jgi:hypothetical protein
MSFVVDNTQLPVPASQEMGFSCHTLSGAIFIMAHPLQGLHFHSYQAVFCTR